ARRPFGRLDVVVLVVAHGCNGKNARVSTGGDDVRDRRLAWRCELAVPSSSGTRVAAILAGVAARCRRTIRLSRALLSRASSGTTRRSATLQLSLADSDRAVLRVFAGGTPEAASPGRRVARARRHAGADRRDAARGDSRGIHRWLSRGAGGGAPMGRLLGAVASIQGCAQRRSCGLLPDDCASRGPLSHVVRAHGLARNRHAMVSAHSPRTWACWRCVLCLGSRHEARRYPCIGRRVLCGAVIVNDFPGGGWVRGSECFTCTCCGSDCVRRLCRRARPIQAPIKRDQPLKLFFLSRNSVNTAAGSPPFMPTASATSGLSARRNGLVASSSAIVEGKVGLPAERIASMPVRRFFNAAFLGSTVTEKRAFES